MPDVIVPGILIAWRGVPVCEEARPILRDQLPAEMMPDGKFPRANSLLGGYQYTRHDPAKRFSSYAADSPETTNQMIYSGQTVMAGATFVHGFILRDALPRELGAFLLSLSVWRAAGGAIGGMSAKGHGRMNTRISIHPAMDQEEVICEYIEHADKVRDEAIGWLGKEFKFERLVETQEGTLPWD